MRVFWFAGLLFLARWAHGSEYWNATELEAAYYGAGGGTPPLLVGLTLIQSAAAKGAVRCNLWHCLWDDHPSPSSLFVLQQSLAPKTADPHDYWGGCKMNHANCNGDQLQILLGFRNQMLSAVRGFSLSRKNGLFINSCFAHCQSERQDTWFANNSPQLGYKKIATDVGDWFFDRSKVNAVDCAYPCDNTCHHIVFRGRY
ncbi:protein notum [Musa troglodytarum]|uniref:Pectin acetylesterase n=1 Tax=Musa troglodytarum TaxID=320322 RepID=A0A9E7K3A2_9LILI|nr:protein notum [Musa troglodytarum]